MDDASCTFARRLLEVILSDDCDDIRGLPVLIPLLPEIRVALPVPFWRQWGVEICDSIRIKKSYGMTMHKFKGLNRVELVTL